ncbi:MAG: NAD(P)/FAD-dependent oxidoreductase [Candidatus Woesearchaeota archaeon]|jgi:geranylgeranyl reductase family protein|nr:NAD(P)/FAD-dependent oxidoreductase [Candidatus Woesearchaeota archaeon]MDP7622884.1 NAD(P)/FAD-dependent oxidoreductase [Candidatus Woesearchaeota archaeon]|tara:strand:+ start:5176 stop:6273 length:1098 start_codon:yes stop_codon:yes gene_type:complete
MITIIGAGPAGSYLAYLLAKKGKDVALIEEHSKIGNPVQCTGIVTGSIEKFVKLKNSVVANKLNKVIITSKNNKTDAKVDEIVLFRDKFDQYISDLAKNQGVKILTAHKFMGIKNKNTIRVKDKKNNKIKTIKSDSIIGADGPSSSVTRYISQNQKSRFYIGMQAKVKLKSNQNEFETYFGNSFPNFFGWAVPESQDTVRLGLASLTNTKHYFYDFLKKRTGKTKILKWESGIIPIYNPKKIIQRNNIYLIGDAAAQVKATTGGGIIPSFKAANTLCDSIINKKNYNKEFQKQSGKELLLHLRIRSILNNFSDKNYDHLLKLMNQKKVKKTLEKYDRDTPIQLILNLLMKEPRFLLFAKKFKGFF